MKTGMVASSIAGVAASAVAAALLIPGPFEALSCILTVAAAILAAVGLLGTGSTTPTGLLTIAFSALAAAGLDLARLDWFGGTPGIARLFWIYLVAGFVAYLIGATAYGFAGTAQGVPVASRTGLLVLLLLGVIPLLDILGLVGILITAIARKPAIRPGSVTG
jgi:hypothetical protein